MRTAAYTRFISNVNQSAFVRSGTMEAMSAATHRSPKVQSLENKDELEEFIVGESVVGGKNIIGKTRPRRGGK